MRKIRFVILLCVFLFSMPIFSGEHGESPARSRVPTVFSRYVAEAKGDNDKCVSFSLSNAWKYISDQFTSLPKGNGDFVTTVTDKTCKNDLESWKSEWGPHKVIGDVKGVKDLPIKLREAGYGLNKKIGTLAISGHAGSSPDSCYVEATQGYIGSGMSDEELKNIRDLMADNGVIWLMGCSTAKHSGPIQKWANRLGLRIVGNTGAVRAGDSWSDGEWFVFEPEK